MPDDNMPDVPLSAEQALLLTEAAERCYEQGDYTTARVQYEQALDSLLAYYGMKNRDTATALRGLGVTLFELGEYAAAQGLLEQALTARKEILGLEHPDTAQVLNGLGCVRFCQNDVGGALDLVERALAIREATLGSDHPDTIESLNNLGVFINRQGDRQRAIDIHTEALARCERTLGDHRSTIETLNALAVKLAREQSTYARARALYERALAMSERVLGATHPRTALLMNNLAAVLSDLDLHTEARALLEQSLALHEQIYGPEHPNTAWVLINLGDVEEHERDYTAARTHFSRALIIREASLGASDPGTIRALRKLVVVLGELGRQGDQMAEFAAMPLHTCLMALETAAGTLAPDEQNMPGVHVDPARAAQNLHELVTKLDAEIRRPPPTPEQQAALQQAAALERRAKECMEAGESAAAQELLEQALATREQALGPMHMDLIPVLQMLEFVLQKSGRSSGVLPIRRRIADIHVAVLGEEHPKSLLVLAELAALMNYEYGPGSADAIWDRVQQAQEAYLGSDDRFTRMTSELLARTRAMRSQQEPAMPPDVESRSEKREASLARPSPLVDEILAGVDSVDWRALHHAYGSAEDVPDQLRLLLSGDEDMREDAYERLFGNIWHQGTVYEASTYAVPFLLRMLADSRTPDRISVSSLLSCIATGSSYLAVHHREGDDTFDWRKLLAEKGEDFDTELERELGWVKTANEAVAEGVDLFFDLLESDDEDAELRLQALATIAVLPSRKHVSVKRLRALLPSMDDRRLRSGIMRTLHELMDESRESQDFFADRLQGDESEAVRLIAAVALLTRAHERSPEQAEAVVLAALRALGAHPHHLDAPAEERQAWQASEQRFNPACPVSPTWSTDSVEFGLGGLVALSGARARIALMRAVQLLQDPEDSLDAARTLLDLVFDEDQSTSGGIAYSRDMQTGVRKIEYWGTPIPPPRQAHELTAAQHEALKTLVDHDPLWEQQSNLLELYGLPTERNDLRSLLTAREQRR